MYKSDHIFGYSLCGTRLTLHFLSPHMDLDLGCGQTCAKYTTWCTQASMKNARPLSVSLLAVCGAVAFSTQLRLSVSSLERTGHSSFTPESFEACDIWIGNREHPSSLLPLCQPCARQWL